MALGELSIVSAADLLDGWLGRLRHTPMTLVFKSVIGIAHLQEANAKHKQNIDQKKPLSPPAISLNLNQQLSPKAINSFGMALTRRHV
jgi:hypothetical protein